MLDEMLKRSLEPLVHEISVRFCQRVVRALNGSKTIVKCSYRDRQAVIELFERIFTFTNSEVTTVSDRNPRCSREITYASSAAFPSHSVTSMTVCFPEDSDAITSFHLVTTFKWGHQR